MKASQILESISWILSENIPTNRTLTQAYKEFGEKSVISFLDSVIRSVVMGSRFKSIVDWRLSVGRRRFSQPDNPLINATIKATCPLIPNKVYNVDITFVFNPLDNTLFLTSYYNNVDDGRNHLLLHGRKYEENYVTLDNVGNVVKKWLRQCDRVLLSDMKNLEDKF